MFYLQYVVSAASGVGQKTVVGVNKPEILSRRHKIRKSRLTLGGARDKRVQLVFQLVSNPPGPAPTPTPTPAPPAEPVVPLERGLLVGEAGGWVRSGSGVVVAVDLAPEPRLQRSGGRVHGGR